MSEAAEGIKGTAEKVGEAVGESDKALPESRRNVWVSNAIPNGSLKAFLDRGGTHAYNETQRLELDLVAYRNAVENLSGYCEKMTAENQELLSKLAELKGSVDRIKKDFELYKTAVTETNERNVRQINIIGRLRMTLEFLGVTEFQMRELYEGNKAASDLFPNAVSVLTDARLNPPKSKPRRKAR